ncbi:glycosyltransferase [Candidatus Pelagibacter bacterium nBUS_36]|uniref:glycosyltransferase n=1 Tax=Candidatus Pelagibacter bacterium nBUS_36 TaxID=3374194 RepID=UPI003EBAD097
MREIILISNDKIFLSKKKLSTSNNDTINIIEAIQNSFNILLLSNNSKNKKNFALNIKNKITKINFKLLFSLKNKKLKIFMISITPRNLFFFILIKFFTKSNKGYVYLRSNGHKEYASKIGLIGSFIYSIMLKYIENSLKVISVSKKIISKKIKFLITPSELDQIWFSKSKSAKLDFPRLLYIGRIKKEKGIYSLLNLTKNFDFKFKLSIVGGINSKISKNKNINFLNEVTEKKKLIKLYDSHNIFVLPSYTEGAPKVILESLARKRPVIIFKNIKHTKLDYKGIFVCDRNVLCLKKKINFIINNFKKIKNDMEKNILPTKKNFQKELLNILNV